MKRKIEDVDDVEEGEVSVDEKEGRERGNGGEDGERDMVTEVDEAALMASLGLPTGFVSTAGRSVPGNTVGAVRVAPKRKVRQLTNRTRGGRGRGGSRGGRGRGAGQGGRESGAGEGGSVGRGKDRDSSAGQRGRPGGASRGGRRDRGP